MPATVSFSVDSSTACRGATAAAHGLGGINNLAAPLHSCPALFSFVRTAPLSTGRRCGRPPSVRVLCHSPVSPYVDPLWLQCRQQPAWRQSTSRLQVVWEIRITITFVVADSAQPLATLQCPAVSLCLHIWIWPANTPGHHISSEKHFLRCCND